MNVRIVKCSFPADAAEFGAAAEQAKAESTLADLVADGYDIVGQTMSDGMRLVCVWTLVKQVD